MATSERFLDSYHSPPPWDVGYPQPALVEALDALGPVHSALDLGCGTGEHALELARRCGRVLGVDTAPMAIELARAKASARGSAARFLVGDALKLTVEAPFSLVLDCGLYHVLEDEERARYRDALSRVLAPGGLHLMLGFASSAGPVQGPRGYQPEDLRRDFTGWEERYVRPAGIATRPGGPQRPALLSLFVRSGASTGA